MRTALLLLASWFVTGYLDAQDTIIETEYFHFGQWSETYWSTPDTVYVFATKCKLRQEPGLTANEMGVLPIGAEVRIVERTGIKFALNGVSSEWLKIENDTISAYVWGGLLTAFRMPLSGNRFALWGVIAGNTDKETPEYISSLRIIADGHLTHHLDFVSELASAPDFAHILKMEHPVLDGVEAVLVVETLADACGVVAAQSYFLLSENGLKLVGSGHGVGDGGIFFSHSEYLFPFEKRKENDFFDRFLPGDNQVAFLESKGEFDDQCHWIENYRVITYAWKAGELIEFCDN